MIKCPECHACFKAWEVDDLFGKVIVCPCCHQRWERMQPGRVYIVESVSSKDTMEIEGEIM